MQKYARNMHEICSTKYAGICTNKQTRNMQYMCITSINMHKYASIKYAHICKIPYA